MGCARRCPTHAEVWLSVLMKFGLKEAPPSRPWLAKILQLTSRYEVSFYEAPYHALALMPQRLVCHGRHPLCQASYGAGIRDGAE